MLKSEVEEVRRAIKKKLRGTHHKTIQTDQGKQKEKLYMSMQAGDIDREICLTP